MIGSCEKICWRSIARYPFAYFRVMRYEIIICTTYRTPCANSSQSIRDCSSAEFSPSCRTPHIPRKYEFNYSSILSPPIPPTTLSKSLTSSRPTFTPLTPSSPLPFPTTFRTLPSIYALRSSLLLSQSTSPIFSGKVLSLGFNISNACRRAGN